MRWSWSFLAGSMTRRSTQMGSSPGPSMTTMTASTSASINSTPCSPAMTRSGKRTSSWPKMPSIEWTSSCRHSPPHRSQSSQRFLIRRNSSSNSNRNWSCARYRFLAKMSSQPSMTSNGQEWAIWSVLGTLNSSACNRSTWCRQRMRTISLSRASPASSQMESSRPIFRLKTLVMRHKIESTLTHQGRSIRSKWASTLTWRSLVCTFSTNKTS